MTAHVDRDLLAALVHEVRSPVAALSAIAQALTAGDVDDVTGRQLADLAIAAARGIERVVGDAAVGSVRLQEVDVGRLVRESVAAVALGGAPVRASIANGVPVIDADPFRLRQALDNLVANALAHTPPGGEVVVSARKAEEKVLLAVTDSGQGIATDDQARIFEPGVRLDVHRPGQGLGLAIARAIADAHDGTLTVTSTPGEGATFTIALPAVRR